MKKLNAFTLLEVSVSMLIGMMTLIAGGIIMISGFNILYENVRISSGILSAGFYCDTLSDAIRFAEELEISEKGFIADGKVFLFEDGCLYMDGEKLSDGSENNAEISLKQDGNIFKISVEVYSADGEQIYSDSTSVLRFNMEEF